MATYDLAPAAKALAGLVAGVRDDQLGAPTPCSEYTLGDLIDHVSGLALGFALAAEKRVPDDAPGPSGDASQLGDGWRERVAGELDALADAWRAPEAWDGMTRIAGLDLPGGVAGVVALDELVIHAWDVARASGQGFDPAAGDVEQCHAFLSQAAGNGDGPFGAPVEVPADAPLLDRLIGLSGRDPSWSAA